MARSVPAFINPTMLVWAREKAGLSLEEAADAISISVDKLAAAECGAVRLTFPQFLAAANAYRRAPSLFYLASPPDDFQPIQDFRRLIDAPAGAYTPELTAVLRQAQERRELALELRGELGEPPTDFALGASLRDDEDEVGTRIREFLGVTIDEQRGWRAKAFEQWRQKIEARDVLVFLVPGLSLHEMRGAAIADSKLPVVLVNSKDRTNGRVFTLLHEFCHIIIRTSGVSGFGADERRPEAARVERFCNAVAAATLVPRDVLVAEPSVAARPGLQAWDDDILNALALRFGVSQEVVLRRLLSLGRTSRASYEERRAMFQRRYDELNARKATGAPPPPVLKVSQLGRAYAQLIFQAYYDRRLTLRDVSNYFNMQVKSIPALEKAAFGLFG